MKTYLQNKEYPRTYAISIDTYLNCFWEGAVDLTSAFARKASSITMLHWRGHEAAGDDSSDCHSESGSDSSDGEHDPIEQGGGEYTQKCQEYDASVTELSVDFEKLFGTINEALGDISDIMHGSHCSASVSEKDVGEQAPKRQGEAPPQRTEQDKNREALIHAQQNPDFYGVDALFLGIETGEDIRKAEKLARKVLAISEGTQEDSLEVKQSNKRGRQ